MGLSTTCAERDALAIPQPDWEWSTDPEIWPRQFEAALAAKGISRSSASKKPATASPKKRRRTAKPLPAATCWEEDFARSLPYRPRCADDFELGVYPCQREIALGYRYVQYNAAGRICWLVSDIDHAGARDAWKYVNLPMPSLVLENPANGHAHLAWRLRIPVSGTEPEAKQLRYLSAIERGFTRRLNADIAFSMLGLVKNAMHPDWRVSRLYDGSYLLDDLARPLSRDEVRVWTKAERETGLGRNVSVFDDLSPIAYSEVRRFKSDGLSAAQFRDRLQDVADRLNLNPRFHPGPLSFSELRGIVVSVSRWTWNRFSTERFSEIQSKRGVRGMASRWAGHTTAAERAAAAGVSRATLYRQQKAANGKAQGETITISGDAGYGGQGAHMGNPALPTTSGLIVPSSAPLQLQHHDRAERRALFTQNSRIERTAA